MLIGIQLGDLSRRSRIALVFASLLFMSGLALYFIAPQPIERLLRVWLLAVIALGLYWLSFLLDFRGRLNRAQTIVASLFALLPWVLVLILVIGYPQFVIALLPHGQ